MVQEAGLTEAMVTDRRFIKVDDFLDLPDIQEVIRSLGLPPSLDWVRQQVEGKIASITVTATRPR